MKKIIVTTTINKPTKATLRFCSMQDWTFIIVGDVITPHKEYLELEKKYKNVLYLTPEIQEKKYKKLSDLIGWRSIQRRNIGFVEAYHLDADIIATVDDDNIPYSTWGKHIYVGQTIDVTTYQTQSLVFDPLSVTQNNFLWHRGFPIQLLKERLDIKLRSKKMKRKVLVQADLWNGDPDIDALARLTFSPEVTFDRIKAPYASNKISPFNSQNTFLSRDVLPYYAVLPHIGRMDDIWGGYIMQYHFPNSVIYNTPTVYQDRNKQDLIKNLENELLGYRDTLSLVKNIAKYSDYLPPKTLEFFRVYQKSFK